MAPARFLYDQVGTLLRNCASLFMAPRCRGCGEPLLCHASPFLCADCSEKVAWIGPGACPGCGYPAGPYARHSENCYRCRDGWMRLDGAAVAAHYADGAKEIVTRLKYRGELELADPIRRVMTARHRTSHFFGQTDVVVPVPLHAKRQRERGYNQSALLARAVAADAGLPLDDGAIVRIRETVPQIHLQRETRLVNLVGAFASRRSLAGKRVLLVDDVMTTGATMAACAEALRDGGARAVYGLVFAR
ncbi:MAG: ComF family protein [Planctomycetaceae bacterium]|nr:ComF family protein [Planctomycetaceae bacterium]